MLSRCSITRCDISIQHESSICITPASSIQSSSHPTHHENQTAQNHAELSQRPYKPLPKGPRGGVELLLIHSVEHVGKQGQVVEVKPGYAYNYLIPHGLATLASDHHKRMVDKHKVKLQQIELARQAELAQAGRRARQAEHHDRSQRHRRRPPVRQRRRADIVAALKNNDIHLSADQIRLEGPLKELGLYTVKVRYSSEVEGELKVWVVPTVAAEA